MADLRQIRKVVRSRPTLEGAGVHLHRAIGLRRPEEYDPFLLLDDFRSDDFGEPIAWRGPIVMNTQEELRIAFEELDQGTFIKTR
jgi:redox-sensitive bicupin YhaK (pirin superfamily)